MKVLGVHKFQLMLLSHGIKTGNTYSKIKKFYDLKSKTAKEALEEVNKNK